MAPLQQIVSPELSLRIRAFHQTNMSGNSNDLYNAFNTSATSQATAGDSPVFRGPYGQNGVTTRQSPPTSGEHETLIANSFSGPAEQTDEDRIDKLSMSFPRIFGPRDPYSRPSTPAPDYHHATASPNKIDIIVRKALADTARAQEQLALEVIKPTTNGYIFSYRTHTFSQYIFSYRTHTFSHHGMQQVVPLFQPAGPAPPCLIVVNLYLRNYESLQAPYHIRIG